jgi:hypothetical protein
VSSFTFKKNILLSLDSRTIVFGNIEQLTLII